MLGIRVTTSCPGRTGAGAPILLEVGECNLKDTGPSGRAQLTTGDGATNRSLIDLEVCRGRPGGEQSRRSLRLGRRLPRCVHLSLQPGARLLAKGERQSFGATGDMARMGNPT
jgi:hypothetical protein